MRLQGPLSWWRWMLSTFALSDSLGPPRGLPARTCTSTSSADVLIETKSNGRLQKYSTEGTSHRASLVQPPAAVVLFFASGTVFFPVFIFIFFYPTSSHPPNTNIATTPGLAAAGDLRRRLGSMDDNNLYRDREQHAA